MWPPRIEQNTSVPPVNILIERTHKWRLFSRARVIAPSFALTHSRARRVRGRSYFERLPPGPPAARRRRTVTNSDTAITSRIIPAPSESCKQDERATTQDRSGPPAAPHCHSATPSRPLSRAHTTVQYRRRARSSLRDTNKTVVMGRRLSSRLLPRQRDPTQTQLPWRSRYVRALLCLCDLSSSCGADLVTVTTHESRPSEDEE